MIFDGSVTGSLSVPHIAGHVRATNFTYSQETLDSLEADVQAAPDIHWVAWVGAAVSPETAPAKPYYLRAPDAKPPKDPLLDAAQPSAS